MPRAMGSSLWGGIVRTEHDADQVFPGLFDGTGWARTTLPTWGRVPPPTATTRSSPISWSLASRWRPLGASSTRHTELFTQTSPTCSAL